MKKFLLVAMAAGAMIPVSGEGLNPVILDNFLTTKISSDGKVIVSKTDEETSIYYLDTKETVTLDQAFDPGNGNSVSSEGKYIVGSTEMDFPVLLVNGKDVDLTDWAPSVALLDFHGITDNGSRIVGITSNPNVGGTETMYAPIYVDRNADGSLGEIKYLPYPAKDWIGLDVQYCSAVWVSNDGKTILGQVVDWSGMDRYPIIYSEGADGEWSYSLPTEAYINPDNLPLPVYPGDFDVPEVKYEDYMTPEAYAAYEAAVNEYYSTWEGEVPNPADYMTPEQAAAYNAAADAYNAAAQEYNEKIMAFFDEKIAIEDSSLFFIQNAMAMAADGKTIAMTASMFVENDDPNAWYPWLELMPTYVYDVASKELKAIEDLGLEVEVVPYQILSDGTIISNTANGATVPTAYVLTPGADKYVEIVDYLAEKAPAAAEWMKENLEIEIENYDWENDIWTYDTYVAPGFVAVSDDWSVLSGGSYNSNSFMYQSYVITPDVSGIASVDADAKVVSKKYYDLNGLEVKDPANGIYIIRSVYSDGTVKAEKVIAE